MGIGRAGVWARISQMGLTYGVKLQKYSAYMADMQMKISGTTGESSVTFSGSDKVTA